MSAKVFALVSVPSCATKKKESMTDAEIGVLVLLGFIVFIVGFVLYVKALVNAANSDRWGWVILMLVVWPLFIFYRSKPKEDRRFSVERREPSMREEP